MILVVTSLEQVATGIRIADGVELPCEACDVTLREGDEAVVVLRQPSAANSWSVHRRFCARCGRSQTLDDPGTALVVGRVGVASDARTQTTWACLLDPEPISALLRRPGDPGDPIDE